MSLEKPWKAEKFDVEEKRKELIEKIMELSGDQLFKVKEVFRAIMIVEEGKILSADEIRGRLINITNEADKEPLFEEIERGIDSVL